MCAGSPCLPTDSVTAQIDDSAEKLNLGLVFAVVTTAAFPW